MSGRRVSQEHRLKKSKPLRAGVAARRLCRAVNGRLPEVNRWADLVNATNEDVVKNQILLPYLSNQLWFNKRQRVIESLRIFDAIPIQGKSHHFEGYTLLLEVNYFEGLYEKYRFAIGFAKGREEKKLRQDFPDSIMARITFGGKKGVLFDASYSENYRKNLFNLLKRMSGPAQKMMAWYGLASAIMRKKLWGM